MVTRQCLAWLIAAVMSVGAYTGVAMVRATTYGTLSSSEDLENSCSLGCAIGWHVEASSSLSGFDVSKLDDNKLATPWVAGEGRGVGESITFRFPASLFGDFREVRFTGFMIIPGYAGSESRYPEFARPKSLSIEWNGAQVATVSLLDRRADQFITIPGDIYLEPDDFVTVRITEVYPGSKMKPVAIAALVPQGAH